MFDVAFAEFTLFPQFIVNLVLPLIGILADEGEDGDVDCDDVDIEQEYEVFKL